jgi:hypothetical protein
MKMASNPERHYPVETVIDASLRLSRGSWGAKQHMDVSMALQKSLLFGTKLSKPQTTLLVNRFAGKTWVKLEETHDSHCFVAMIACTTANYASDLKAWCSDSSK